MKNSLIEFLKVMEEQQKKKLLKTAELIAPQVTWDDILQPQDFPVLEESPLFRYEEGILAGLEMARVAIQSRDFL